MNLFIKNIFPVKRLARIALDFLYSLWVFANYLLHDKDDFENELAIVAVCKDEGPYLKEWIEYHRIVGVERFYIFDNESSDNTRSVLEPYIKSGIVVYKFVKSVPLKKGEKGNKLQYKVYNNAVVKYRNKCKWMAFIDIDEFIVPLQYEKIPDVLNEIKSTVMKDKLLVSLAVHWVYYLYGGHRTKPEGLVIENFTESSGPHKIVKSIVNPRTVINCDIHNMGHFFGLHSVNENGRTLPPPYSSEEVTTNEISKIRINHYWTKSYEECKKKLERNYNGWDKRNYYRLVPPFEVKTEEDLKIYEARIQPASATPA